MDKEPMMSIEELINQLREGKELRSTLSLLKAELKTPGQRSYVLRLLQGDLGPVEKCLSSEDAKTRKNAAGVLGALARQESLRPLYEAYRREETLFVRSAYPEAMRKLNCTEVLPELRDLRDELAQREVPAEEKKHRDAELLALNNLIGDAERGRNHRFRGMDEDAHVLLLTNRNYTEEVRKALEERGIPAKTFTAGVIADPAHLKEIYAVRTFSETLFPVPGCPTVPDGPEEAAEALAKSGLSALARKYLEGEPPYAFRVDLRTREEKKDEARTFAREFAGRLTTLSNGDWISRPSDYEVELRLVANSAGTWNVLVKFMNLPDPRFTYRRAATSSSLAPLNAAMAVDAARPFLKEGARVLDPMCGSGVLLVERMKALGADTLYGLDVNGEAIRAAEGNLKNAGLFAHLVRRDFRDFTHEHLFDEVITDFPVLRGAQTKPELVRLYRDFFRKMPELVREGGLLVLYTHDLDLVRRESQRDYRILRVFEVSRRENCHIVILRKGERA